jgi:tetratricopeptide (TPR) repeat protein
MAGLALVHLSDDIDHSAAMIERSLLLKPNSANAWIAACLLHSYLCETEKAIDAFNRAQRLNPLDLSQHLHWNMVAWAYLGLAATPRRQRLRIALCISPLRICRDCGSKW